MKMREENYDGDPQEYLRDYVKKLESIKEMDVLCPNCFKSKVLQENKIDCSCPKCGQEFTFIDNTLMFK